MSTARPFSRTPGERRQRVSVLPPDAWQTGRVLRRTSIALAAVLLPLAACSAEADEAPATHSHGSGVQVVSMPVGDGTRAQEVGYSLADVGLPARAGKRGDVTFVVQTFRGTPQTSFITEQTKDL